MFDWGVQEVGSMPSIKKEKKMCLSQVKFRESLSILCSWDQISKAGLYLFLLLLLSF